MANDLVQVTLVGTCGNGQPWSTSFKVFGAAGVDGPDLLGIAQRTYDEYDNSVKANFPATTVLTHVEAQKVEVSQGRLVPLSVEQVSVGAALPGTGGGSALPNFCAVVFSYRADAPGPRNRNRMYLPPVDEADVGADGDLNSTFRAALLTDILAMIVEANNDNVVDSTVWRGVNFVDESSWDVVSWRIDPHVGTMRSRMISPST